MRKITLPVDRSNITRINNFKISGKRFSSHEPNETIMFGIFTLCDADRITLAPIKNRVDQYFKFIQQLRYYLLS